MSRFLPLTVIALCAALALTSCSESEGPLGRSVLPRTPSAQVNINREGGVELFFEEEIPNHCLEETVLVSGVIRIRVMSVESDAGSHQNVQFIVRGTGVGQTSGAIYTFHNSHVVASNSNSLGAEERTEVINIFLVSKGDSANSAFQVEVHWTRSATGEITVDFVKAGCVQRG
jgi:hypothetical protein